MNMVKAREVNEFPGCYVNAETQRMFDDIVDELDEYFDEIIESIIGG